MLLEAGFLSIFFAPRGFRPRLGDASPPSRASLFMLRWEWFRIYFESGIVKLASGDPHWRDLTAMDEYYQNGPLPTWIGWYVQHLPHWYHAGTVVLTLLIELAIVVGGLSPAPVPARVCRHRHGTADRHHRHRELRISQLPRPRARACCCSMTRSSRAACAGARQSERAGAGTSHRWTPRNDRARLELGVLAFLFYATIAAFVEQLSTSMLSAPARWLRAIPHRERVRAVRGDDGGRYEIEFQGAEMVRPGSRIRSATNRSVPTSGPGIYAPYQPRFEWNLWFASLGPWQQASWVVLAQRRLVEGSPSVLRLFRSDPFHGKPPALV
jgi:hypothetical protein